MKSIESFVERYKRSLSSIPDDIRYSVNRDGGLTEKKLLDLIINPKDYGVLNPEHPLDSDIDFNNDVEKCRALGKESIKKGHVAYCIMAGGAGTRIGEPKALLKIPELDISLLSLKLFQAKGNGPIWIVTSPSLKRKIFEHVKAQADLEETRFKFIEQYESYRLTPDNQIFMKDGVPDLYPCGHGDLFPALVSSGILERFVGAGGKYVAIVNVDNIAAALDPVIIGRHILAGKKVSCEVVKRSSRDSGGVLCNVNNSLQILEDFKIHGVDAKAFQWLNTNSFVINADIDLKPLGSAWNRVQKNINENIIIQHERLLQEITAAYDTSYLFVERSERFVPIKSSADLETAAQYLKSNRKIL